MTESPLNHFIRQMSSPTVSPASMRPGETRFPPNPTVLTWGRQEICLIRHVAIRGTCNLRFDEPSCREEPSSSSDT